MGMLVGGTLAGIFAISMFSILRFAVRKERSVDRLEMWMNDVPNAEISEDKADKPGLLNVMGDKFERAGFGRAFTEKTRIELVRADIPLTGYEFNLLRSVVGLALAAAVAVVFRNGIASAAMIPTVWVLADSYVSSKKAKRLKQFSNQLGDALTLFANSLRAGFSFLQAVSSVAREMPEPISKEFTRLLKEMSLGLSVEKALENLLKRVPQDDLELLIIAILIQKEVGGNLAEIVDTIAFTIRERITIQREIKTMTAQGRLSGIVVGLLPVFMCIMMLLINKEYMLVLFTDPLGRMMIGAGLLNMGIGIFLINKIVDIEV